MDSTVVVDLNRIEPKPRRRRHPATGLLVLNHFPTQKLPTSIYGHGKLISIRLGVGIRDLLPFAIEGRTPLDTVSEVAYLRKSGEFKAHIPAFYRQLWKFRRTHGGRIPGGPEEGICQQIGNPRLVRVGFGVESGDLNSAEIAAVDEARCVGCQGGDDGIAGKIGE